MTFVFKKFTDADKLTYDGLHLKTPLNVFRYPPYWVVDEERDALMVSFGGQGDQPPERGSPPDFYALAWGGQVVEIEGYYQSTFPAKGKEVIWYRMELRASKILENKLEIISDMVHEALLAFEGLRKYPAEAVHVEFTKLFFL